MHDEIERGLRDDPGHLARVREHPSVHAAGAGPRVPQDDQLLEHLAGFNYWIRCCVNTA